MAKDDVSAIRSGPARAAASAAETPSAPNHPAYLWHNGRLVPWAGATVHLTEIGWTAISAVFEGIRAYARADRAGLAFFRVDQHLKRLGQSMKLMRMAPPFPLEVLHQGMADLLRANEVRDDVYLQPVAYFGGNVPGYRAAYTQPGNLYVTLRETPSLLGRAPGSHLCVSTWARIGDNVMPPRVKAMANYQNSRLVSTEARINGYDGGIMLNDRGKVAEGASSCLFLIRDGVAITPNISSGILESVTRASLIELLEQELGVPTEEREVDRTELYLADELFLCGTLAEIEPALSVDRYAVGNGETGPVTQSLIDCYRRVVRGQEDRYLRWLEPVTAAGGPAWEDGR